MSRYEKKNKEKDPLTKGAATPANGPINELDEKNIVRIYGNRHRSWNLIVYPGESLPENWKAILGDLMIPWAISPLHDEDLNADGEKKKAHRHLLLSFHTVKSYAQIKDISTRLGSAPPEPCLSTRGTVRYFLHLDNPEKARYKQENIEYGGGFDLENALKATASEEEEILHAICDFLEDNWITEFATANKEIRRNKKEWWGVFRKNSFLISQIIKSQRHNPRQ